MNAHAPIKLGDRQEQFCQQILSGRSAMQAYRIAYNASESNANANANRLMGKDWIKARIEQLRADKAAAERVTIPFLTRHLLDTAAEARASLQHGAAQSCYSTVAKMHGLLNDKVQLELTVRKPSASPDSPDDMTEQAWLDSAGLIIEHMVQSTDQADQMIKDDSPIDQMTSIDRVISTPGLHPESGGQPERVPGAKRSEEPDQTPPGEEDPPALPLVEEDTLYTKEPESQNPMPMKSEKQRKAMHAAAKGKSTAGIPKSVAKKFVAHDSGGKLPAKAKSRKK